MDTAKHQTIMRKRLVYIMLVLDVLIVTKIWVDGFSHIITVLSLMAAGLVVANKESVMNLIGGLIISWRDLFVEGDFIQIHDFSGYVASIGVMYFKLYETTSIEQKKATGRTIKIPNSFVITFCVVNFSPDSNLCLQKIYLDYKDDRRLRLQDKYLAEADETLENYHPELFEQIREQEQSEHKQEIEMAKNLNDGYYLERHEPKLALVLRQNIGDITRRPEPIQNFVKGQEL
ncbi:MAG: mechanosensitive ion channel family protein, partial [Gammaproteobacteria bacterium]|nr:mechanosensitive ion channel family protein [Gammaproteobacteria bacterium]